MCHNLLQDASVFAFLLECDRDVAAQCRSGGCTVCGDTLHSARFQRKPRGGPPDLGRSYEYRESFCCASCRRRTTPPSLRFLGRKVYLGAVVVLVSTMRHGAKPARVAELRKRIGVSERTIVRWRAWWQESFAASPFWQASRGRFDTPVVTEQMPLSLLDRFAGDERDRLISMLRFLAPITTASAGGAMAF